MQHTYWNGLNPVLRDQSCFVMVIPAVALRCRVGVQLKVVPFDDGKNGGR